PVLDSLPTRRASDLPEGFGIPLVIRPHADAFPSRAPRQAPVVAHLDRDCLARALVYAVADADQRDRLAVVAARGGHSAPPSRNRSEEHTSELQSREH